MKRENFIFIFGICIILLISVISFYHWGELPFETISQKHNGALFTVYSPNDPTLMIITKPEEFDLINQQLHFIPEVIEPIRTVDYQKYFVIVVLEGVAGWTHPSFAIQIQQVTRSGSQVSIKAHWAKSLVGDPNIGMPGFSLPYHVIKVEKRGKWASDIVFILNNDGKAVAKENHFVP